jgi:anti-sigma B factor antagonist
MSNLSIQSDQIQGIVLLKVQGRVDSESASEFDQALTQALGEDHKVVLNLQGVEFLSSSGLRAIVKAYQAAKKAGGDVLLSAVSEPVEVVLRTVGMMQLLKMYPTDQEAVKSF